MAESTKDEKEKKTVKIKATRGAWWKSKPADESVESPPVQEKKEEKPKRTPRAKKNTPAKSAAKKTPTRKPRVAAAKAPPNEKTETGTIAGDVVATDDVAANTVDTQENVEKKETAIKAQKPRRPRKPRAAAKKTAASTQKSVEEDLVAPVDAESTETVVNDVAAESTAEEKPKPKKPAGRRGRRPKAAPKELVPEETTAIEEGEGGIEAAQTVETSAVAEDTAEAEQDAEDIAEQGKTSSNKKAPRKKQTQKPKKDSQEAVADTEEADEDETSREEAKEEQKEEEKKVCKLLINAEEPEECRLALLEDGRLESINVTTVAKTQRKNNIYKARIVAIEPSLQAAFVEYGTEKNGFLPFSEIHPEYFKQDLSDNIRHLVETQQWKKLSITDVVERGQDILAQVVKEEVGKKGANMTTFLSIPGRCVVLMPGSDSSGISRKISGETRRSQLRDTMQAMEIPEGIGWIVRTASNDINEEALSRDVDYLLNLWEDIKAKGQSLDGVGLVYEEQHSILRFLREHFDPSIQEILVDDKTALEQVKDFVKMLPRSQRSVSVRLHQGARPIFNQFSVEDQIESIYQPRVTLPSGGSIVIDPTEALVAIDVNSGSTSKGKNFEASIFQANMEAAAELARQLRLRDLGGLIVVDFIDMRSRKNIIAVEKKVRAAMKRDRAKVDFSRISKFGLMQISRQKLGAPIESGNYHRCEHCKGRGVVRSIETLSLFYLRRIQTGASRKSVEAIECHLPMDVASYLLNQKRNEINEMEKRYNVEITIQAESDMKPSENEIIFHKAEKEGNNKKQA